MGRELQAIFADGVIAERESMAESETTASNILVVHEVVPHTDRSGTDARLMQVLRELRRQGHEVTFVARNGVDADQYAPALEEIGIRVFAHDAERLRSFGIQEASNWKLNRVFERGPFDLAILSLWFWSGISIPEQYLDAIRQISPATRIVVLTDDQHGEREKQMSKLTGLLSDAERAADFAEREIDILRRADFSVAISEEDRAGLTKKNPEIVVGVLPMVANIAPEEPAFAERSDLLFLGDFDNLANRDAINWMRGEIWPKVRKRLPEVRFAIAGNNLPRDLASENEGLVGLGHVPDLGPVFAKHRVFVSPIRAGTGIKTKNVAALAHGLPLVTTSTGAKGMALVNEQNALIEDRANDFAGAIVRAYSDESLWHRLSRQGKQHAEREFGSERLSEAVRQMVEGAKAIRPKLFEPEHVWSCRLVEERFPRLLEPPGSANPLLARVECLVRLARENLKEGRAAIALAQLRHVFSFVRGEGSHDPRLLSVYECLDRCYRSLQDKRKAERSRREARKCKAGGTNVKPAASAAGRSRGTRAERFRFSVVIPTYNRQQTLATCLEALEQQAFAPADFEVIVVDDGSTDGTAEYCRSLRPRVEFSYFRQENSGAGAARRLGVEKARGEYVVFFNDDTIAAEDLLVEHWKAHRSHIHDKLAVLGDFRYPSNADERALTFFLAQTPFLFPQATMREEIYQGVEYFVSCNLSLRRDAIVAAGSFDPAFRVAEDSDLGIRLRQRGYRVLGCPRACATHLHERFSIRDLIRRAKTYGRTQLQLFRKHPALLREGAGVFGRLDSMALKRLREMVERGKKDVEDAAAALEGFDSIDFKPYFQIQSGERTAAEEVMALYARAVPEVYFHYFYESFLQASDEEAGLDSLSRANCDEIAAKF